MFSTVATALLTMRLATGALSQEEFGLWSFTTQTVGYFLLLDFGVSNSLGRLFAEPLASGEQTKINSWFTLAVGVLILQGIMIIGVGLVLRNWVVAWFGIPVALKADAERLWLAFLVIQAINLPLRLSSAILYAQNRAYLSNLFPMISTWFSLGVFYYMLKHGSGVMSYAWSSGIGVIIGGCAGVIALCMGPHRFGISLLGVSKRQLRELFSYSSSVFLIAIAIQLVFASQTLIITKVLGLAAGAMYTVTSRLPMLAMQMIWKPFDAFGPRWQTAHCSDQPKQVASEFRSVFRLTLILTVIGMVGVILVNPFFVAFWAKPEYFAGNSLNLLLAVFILAQTFTHCFSFAFNLHKKMRALTLLNFGGIFLTVILMIVGVHFIGFAGVPAGLLVTDLSFGFWYVLRKGGGLLQVNATSIIRMDIGYLIGTLCAAGLLALTWQRWLPTDPLMRLSVGCGATLLLSLPLVYRAWTVVRTSSLLPSSADAAHRSSVA